MNVLERIQAFNAPRDPARLAFKYEAMAADPYAFLRGTCHLFYQDLPRNWNLHDAPLAWVCGDLHLQNFGSYRGDNVLVYFDINDFDESALAPLTWDLVRLLTSLFVAARVLKLDEDDAQTLSAVLLDAYAAALREGRPGWVERSLSRGVVRDLLVSLKSCDGRTFLDHWTERRSKRRRFAADSARTPPADKLDRQKVERMIAQWAAGQPDPDFFRVVDIAERVAGIGSLGVERYIVLVEGDGSPHENHLLDLKFQPGSSLTPYLITPQPAWIGEAERVAAMHRRMQAAPPAPLGTLDHRGASYTLRALQPYDQKVSLPDVKRRHLPRLLATVGQIVAWDQLRSSGRGGSANADALIAFAADPRWRTPLLSYAVRYAAQVVDDWRTFTATR